MRRSDPQAERIRWAMDRDRWQKIEQVFAEAVELPIDQSVVYLDRVCGEDTELRREVDLLLDSDRKAQGQVGSAIGHAAAAFAVQMQREYSASQIGRRIGPYEIVREIGRGGMGSVYQAVRNDDQYIRSVAIKFIAQGVDTDDALVRFRTERQILATLQHPNIAGLLDGGATSDGQPYIVMEYIEGEPLLDYCKRRNLSVNERLQIFASLCSAVHHAHQMLVIHRDIKPGNILVTSQGIPKLLDFGIAKLMTPELVVGGIAATKTQLRRMTPQYASPEQIRGDVLTTATDVYSLGVLLYEMLTFASPYRVTTNTSEDMERAVRDGEPVRLSAAVQNDPKLRRQLSGDLETIVGMALRKEPQRRYGSVQQFADDIQRFLSGLPVSAREDTIFYLATKLVRRNLLASAAFALLAVSIAIGWYSTYLQAKRTEARFQEVRKLANSLLFDLHRKIQDLPGATPARELLVKTALEYLNNLSRDASQDLSLQWELSQAWEQVGDVQGDPAGPNLGHYRDALTSYQRALGLVAPLVDVRHDYLTESCAAWLYFKQGDLELRLVGSDNAIDSYRKGLQLVENIRKRWQDARGEDLLVNGYMRLATARTRVAAAHQALTEAQAAADAADRAGTLRKDGGIANRARTRLLLGNILWLRGDLNAARHRYGEAVDWLQRMADADPENREVLEELEQAYRQSGDLQGNPAYFHFGNLQAAQFFHRKSLRLAEQLASRDPDDASARAHLSVALRRMGAVTRTTEPAHAVELYRESIDLTQKLLENSPGDLNYQRDLANSYLGLSAALRAAGKYKIALEQVKTAIAMQRDMLQHAPERIVIREDIFESILGMAQLRMDTHEYDMARSGYSEALDNAQFLAERNRDSLYSQRCLAMVYEALGGYHSYFARNGKPEERDQHALEANNWYEKALGIWTRWKSQNLAVPFSSDREREVLREKALVPASPGT